MLLFVLAVSIVLVVSFLCSIFESVLLSISRAQVETLVQQGRRAGRLLSKFKTHIDVPIAAILILNTAAHTVGASVAGASYSSVFAEDTLWLFTVVFTLAVLLFTEIIPKTLGVTYADRLASPVAHGIDGLTKLLRPLVLVSEKISRLLRGRSDVPVTSIEEIRLLASLGRNEGVVGTRTAGMIVGATHLSQLAISDVMLPRQSVVCLSTSMGRQDVLDVLRHSGHSRFPLTDKDDLDHVQGVVLAKELLYWMQDNPQDAIDWPAVSREPIIVPESMPILRLLRNFQGSRRHLAIVVDEYGTVAGIATLEDVLEEIVGEIEDESDRPSADMDEQPDGSLVADASVDLRKLCSRLGLPWQPEEDVTSVGGLVMELLGRIPERGDSVEWNGFRISVIAAGDRKAERVSIRKI